jgi:hypothetical protein
MLKSFNHIRIYFANIHVDRLLPRGFNDSSTRLASDGLRRAF